MSSSTSASNVPPASPQFPIHSTLKYIISQECSFKAKLINDVGSSVGSSSPFYVKLILNHCFINSNNSTEKKICSFIYMK